MYAGNKFHNALSARLGRTSFSAWQKRKKAREVDFSALRALVSFGVSLTEILALIIE
jgi:hypothetical protein